ncbi:helix-turn-helix domain-containing protein [Acinetobacter modestus]|uniref:helix-turn-helix domain-containing protein n=1 Tax=Acinetobacter modestus TaxID=1776740 RepID=UPI001F4AC743|nr:helix-turn-helix domain-containing protein [Acinetobacter modestus]MCH7328969.1 helix-turn-helix domain-containing protein [Acinetobacter modestus]
MRTSQIEQVLAHLKQGNTISQAEAINNFNCYRLSAVIKQLRNQGYEIMTRLEPNLKSKGTHARYELKEVAA